MPQLIVRYKDPVDYGDGLIWNESEEFNSATRMGTVDLFAQWLRDNTEVSEMEIVIKLEASK